MEPSTHGEERKQAGEPSFCYAGTRPVCELTLHNASHERKGNDRGLAPADFFQLFCDDGVVQRKDGAAKAVPYSLCDMKQPKTEKTGYTKLKPCFLEREGGGALRPVVFQTKEMEKKRWISG